LLRYLWWFVANQVCRWRDRHFRGLVPELVYSPGVNCLDADLVGVHISFAKLRRELRNELRLMRNPIRSWPVILHRRIYYSLIERLEGLLYSRKDVALTSVSQLVAQDIRRFHARPNGVSVVYHGLDASRFSAKRRQEVRLAARLALGISDNSFAVLLVGNDWKKKGLSCLLEACSRLQDPRLQVLVVGNDLRASYGAIIRRLGLSDQVTFLPLRPDVEFYYAAADLYAGPSLEDAFALPPAEAMACGLPVITTRMAGVSEIIHHGVDGIVLEDPTDAEALSGWINRLLTEPALRKRLGDAAAQTASQYTWERNAEQMRELFEQVRRNRKTAS
jgi:UDP-glucose:(heptosyl)LPS alpha-1,3-glucosyltransferase